MDQFSLTKYMEIQKSFKTRLSVSSIKRVDLKTRSLDLTNPIKVNFINEDYLKSDQNSVSRFLLLTVNTLPQPSPLSNLVL